MQKKYRLPSITALVAFESAARLLSFSKAAEELSTSQSAISRHISELEARLNTLLFERIRKGQQRVALTKQGEQFYRLVVSGLESLQLAVSTSSNRDEDNTLTIACTHEVSHLVLMPVFNDFQKAIGDQISINILTSEYELMERFIDRRIDILLSYQHTETNPKHFSLVFNDAIKPVCSPDFYKTHQQVLSNPADHWIDLPFLKMTKQNQGWVNWEDWFTRQKLMGFSPKFISFDNYVYLLEAAVSGQGIALGWKGLIERYLKSSSLVPLTDDYEHYDSGLYATLTEKGKVHPCGLLALDFFSGRG